MKQVIDDVIAFCRMFAAFEREDICCGTVTPAQCVVLQTLRCGEWDLSTLAGHARVTKGAMTRLVDGLERRELVARTQSSEDARRFFVSLTTQGKAEASRLVRLTERSVTTILSRVPAEERDQVVRSLHLLRRAAEETRSQLDCC